MSVHHDTSPATAAELTGPPVGAAARHRGLAAALRERPVATVAGVSLAMVGLASLFVRELSRAVAGELPGFGTKDVEAEAQRA